MDGEEIKLIPSYHGPDTLELQVPPLLFADTAVNVRFLYAVA